MLAAKQFENYCLLQFRHSVGIIILKEREFVKNKIRSKDIVIPESVTNISDSVFVSCSGLSSINIKGESCNVFDSSDTIPANTTIIINGSKNVYEVSGGRTTAR